MRWTDRDEAIHGELQFVSRGRTARFVERCSSGLEMSIYARLAVTNASCRPWYQWRDDGVAAASSDGGPTGGRGPPTVLEFLVINFTVCLVLWKLKNAERHNQELAKN